MNKNDNKDYEFDAELRNHAMGSKKIYRLYYINYYRKNGESIGVINAPFEPFMLPEGMERNDAFKVLSYLTDYIEKNTNVEPCSYRSVKTLDEVLKLSRLGFKKLDIELDSVSQDVIDLFTVDGRILLFKDSILYQKYFEWYTEGITLEDVKNIYKKIGFDFYDLVPVDNSNRQEKAKTK